MRSRAVSAASGVASHKGKSKRGGGPRKRRGPKASRAQVDKNVVIVENMLGDGFPRSAIVEKLAARGVAEASVDRYIARAHEAMTRDRKAPTEEIINERIARLRALSQRAEKAGRYAAAATIERMLNEIYGVGAAPPPPPTPQGLNVFNFNFSALPDGELDQLERLADSLGLGKAPEPAQLVGDTTATTVEPPR